MSDNNMTNMPEVQPLLKTQQDNGRALIFVLSVMAFMAALALIFALSAQRLKQSWQGELGLSATVQILYETQEARSAKIDTALTVLKAELPQAVITAINDTQARDLLKPWLGNTELPADLPIPALISIDINKNNLKNSRFHKDGGLDIERLNAALLGEGLVTEIDNHSRWSDQIRRTGRSLQTTALFLLVLMLTASIAVSSFATRAALLAQRDIITVLVQVGATDNFITRLFTTQAGQQGLRGGIIGTICGIIITLFLTVRRHSELAILPELGLYWTDGFWLIILIIGFTALSALSAGLTALSLLKKERRYL